MRQASKRVPDSAEKTVRDIRRATRRHHSAEEKIRIAAPGLLVSDRPWVACRPDIASWYRPSALRKEGRLLLANGVAPFRYLLPD
jgi:hypothetical protein